MRASVLTAFLLVLSSTMAGCAVAPRGPARSAPISHAVYFKLKNPADVDELIADCDRDLRGIPGIVTYFCGRRLDQGRSSVDASFDVGFLVGFNSTADYQRYLDHPNHQAAVAKWKPRWESIRIDDAIDPTP